MDFIAYIKVIFHFPHIGNRGRGVMVTCFASNDAPRVRFPAAAISGLFFFPFFLSRGCYVCLQVLIVVFSTFVMNLLEQAVTIR